ncbi:hypothetical protein GE09DRAFT_1051999 [Coniochaeta sp. 2T2.1]|nr:hypothetical protein GE09DRAFT_1051999 [Coniochaeta sp. 2T2.1]
MAVSQSPDMLDYLAALSIWPSILCASRGAHCKCCFGGVFVPYSDTCTSNRSHASSSSSYSSSQDSGTRSTAQEPHFRTPDTISHISQHQATHVKGPRSGHKSMSAANVHVCTTARG